MFLSPWFSATTAHEIFSTFLPLYSMTAEETFATIERKWTQRPLLGRWRAVDDNNVAWMAIKAPGTTVIFFKGLDRLAHVQGFMKGVRIGDRGINAAPFNEFGMAMAQTFFDQGPDRSWYDGQRVFFTGHSMGATAACCLRRLFQGVASSSKYLVTLGEARSTSPIGADQARAWEGQRWMTLNDPICHLPAYSSVAPEAWLLFEYNLQLAINQLVHRQGGMQITIGGDVTPVNNIPVPGQGIHTALVQWGQGFRTGVPQAHNLAYYVAALGNARLREGIAPRPPIVAPPEVPQPRMNLQQANVAANVAFPPAVRVDVPLNEPARGTTPQQKFFEYRKERFVYNVYWQGSIIASFAKRRGASRCVQAGNRFVRAYVRAFAGDDDQFNAAASAFTEALPD